MLSQLYIENVAVIKQSAIEFSEGLNVFTGETGAGKSILIGAIGAILGERVSKDLIRTGEKKAKISALFSGVSQAEREFIGTLGFDVGDGEILISREIGPDSSSCRINGMPATVSMLRTIGQRLINIHGQQDNQMLSSSESHREFLDAYGELAPASEEYRSAYTQLKQVEQELSSLCLDESQKAQKLDLLIYQTNEISSAGLRDGEEEELLARRKVIKNAQEIADALFSVRQELDGAERQKGILDALDEVSGQLRQAGAYLERFLPLAETVEGFRYELEEVDTQVREASEELEYNPGELDDIEERLDLIYRLKRKYGQTVADVITFGQRAEQELLTITTSEERLAELQKQRDICKERAEALSCKLTQARRAAAQQFSEAVQAELISLDMPSVRFVIDISSKPLSPNGADDICFLISANPGEPPKPLSKIASGGEMSRMMLAIKKVISGKDDVGTLIFDEVDTGISGRAAQKVGKKLREVSFDRQVLCVTHLAQVAAFGSRHLLIQKQVEKGQTFTQVRQLSQNERIEELARIMGGEEITKRSLDAAEELLDQSQQDTQPPA